MSSSPDRNQFVSPPQENGSHAGSTSRPDHNLNGSAPPEILSNGDANGIQDEMTDSGDTVARSLDVSDMNLLEIGRAQGATSSDEVVNVFYDVPSARDQQPGPGSEPSANTTWSVNGRSSDSMRSVTYSHTHNNFPNGFSPPFSSSTSTQIPLEYEVPRTQTSPTSSQTDSSLPSLVQVPSPETQDRNPPYSQAELDWICYFHGSEQCFLSYYGLEMNEEDRAVGRILARNSVRPHFQQNNGSGEGVGTVAQLNLRGGNLPARQRALCHDSARSLLGLEEEGNGGLDLAFSSDDDDNDDDGEDEDDEDDEDDEGEEGDGDSKGDQDIEDDGRGSLLTAFPTTPEQVNSRALPYPLELETPQEAKEQEDQGQECDHQTAANRQPSQSRSAREDPSGGNEEQGELLEDSDVSGAGAEVAESREHDPVAWGQAWPSLRFYLPQTATESQPLLFEPPFHALDNYWDRHPPGDSIEDEGGGDISGPEFEERAWGLLPGFLHDLL